MNHHFKHTCYDIDALFDGSTKLSHFMKKLRAQSEQNPDFFKPDDYFGDGFEALVEVLIKCFEFDKRVYISNYTPVSDNDMGVDGFGYGPDGEVHTVQVKARSNTESVLTANRDHISNFVAHSAMKYKTEHMTIFTTAKSLHSVVDEDMYQGKVRTLGFKELSHLVDGNEMFWAEFRNQIKFHEKSEKST